MHRLYNCMASKVQKARLALAERVINEMMGAPILQGKLPKAAKRKPRLTAAEKLRRDVQFKGDDFDKITADAKKAGDLMRDKTKKKTKMKLAMGTGRPAGLMGRTHLSDTLRKYPKMFGK